MELQNILESGGLLFGFFVIFFIGKIVNDKLHPEYNLQEELVEKDNPALALTLTGYYLGLVLTIGGALSGESNGFVQDIKDLALYGVSGIVLLNASWFLCDKIILPHCNVSTELIAKQSLSVGAIAAACSIASGFILFGAIQGDGSFLTMVVYWAIGQCLLILAARFYNVITPFDIHNEIQKNNLAVGISTAGVIISIGTLIGLAAEGDFESWNESLSAYVVYAVLGLVLIPIIRMLADYILLPGASLTDELVNQEIPNIGAAYIEAFSYIAAAFAIYWCV